MEYTKSQIIEAKIREWLARGNAKIVWSEANVKDIITASEKIAEKYGDLISESFGLESVIDELPELKATLMNLRARAAESARALIAITNETNKVNIAAQAASAKSESIDNLISRIQDGTILTGGSIADADKFLLGKSVLKHIASEGIADTLRDNAELATDAGITTTFIRHLGTGGCCKWCQGLAGKYTSADLPQYFWSTHDNCDCWMEYKTSKGHTKISYTNKNSKGKRNKSTADI